MMKWYYNFQICLILSCFSVSSNINSTGGKRCIKSNPPTKSIDLVRKEETATQIQSQCGWQTRRVAQWWWGSVGNPVIAERLSNEILYSSKKGERVVKQERFENGDVDNKVDPKTEKYSFECGKRSQADYLQFALVLSTYMPRAVQRRRQLFCDL